MMAKRHRLGALQMGKARHHCIRIFFRAREQCPLQPNQTRLDGVHGIPHPNAEIRCHLIIARSGCVQSARDRPNKLGKPGLGCHVNIFQRQIDGDAIGFIFLGDLIKPVRNCLGIIG
jgi:hypothetical protein